MKKSHSAGLKYKVALAALTGQKIVDICSRYEVAESLVHKWKKQLNEEGSSVFSSSKKAAELSSEQENAKLYKRIGELSMEVEFLKKVVGD